MYSYFKSELKRAIFSKYFFIAFSISLLLLVYSFFEFITLGWSFGISDFQLLKDHYDFIDLFIMSRSENRASYIAVVAPLLAALVFSDSYLADKTSGYINFIYMRISKKNYILTRLLTNCIASGLAIVIASIFMILLLIIFYGISINNENAVNLTGAFSDIYYNGNKYMYLLIIIGISFVFNCIFSTLSLAISTFVNNKYVSFLAPFFYYIISGSIFVMIGLYKLNSTTLFIPKYDINIFEFIMYQLSLLLIGITTFIYGVLHLNEKVN